MNVNDEVENIGKDFNNSFNQNSDNSSLPYFQNSARNEMRGNFLINNKD
jgi:hypothetical protein